MNDAQLQRYGRHILLDEIGIDGQQQLLDSKAIIIGAGGLGSPAALYLAASGIGEIFLCDDDLVDLSNLQRQIAHRTAALGKSKVDSASTTLRELNPEVVCHAVKTRLDQADLDQLIPNADVVLDCSDNFPTRYAINRACHKHHKPLVSGAAILLSGQASVFDFRRAATPCYNCLFPEDAESEALRCATTGIFAPLTGIIGCIQAAEALKLILNIDGGLNARLLTIDALEMNIRSSTIHPDPTCPICAPHNRTNNG